MYYEEKVQKNAEEKHFINLIKQTYIVFLMSDELGKKYPCFGEFKCPHCNKKWQGSKSWVAEL
jgi:hypothetical protein